MEGQFANKTGYSSALLLSRARPDQREELDLLLGDPYHTYHIVGGEQSMALKSSRDEEPKRRQPPARNPQARENQMIALAVDLTEKQLREGSASAQVITHYLRLATVKEQNEREAMLLENELRRAKLEQVGSTAKLEELMTNALNAFKGYAGQPEDEPDVY